MAQPYKLRGEGLPGNSNFLVGALVADDVPIWDATNLKWTVAQKSTFGVLDHTLLTNIGTNTHPQIDTHIADATVHFTVGSIDHGALAGLGDDDHDQYALIAGDTFTGDVTMPRLRLTATNDLSLAGTLHAFQVGSSAGANIGIDSDEIMARNNGATATLSLNINGGSVAIGADLNAAAQLDSATGVFSRSGQNIITNDGTATSAYYITTPVMRTQLGGIAVSRVGSDAAFIEWWSQNFGVRQGFIQHIGAGGMIIRSETHGAPIIISAEDAGGTTRTILSADPDTSTILRADTNLELEVAASENSLIGVANARVALYYNNVEEARTADSSTTDQMSGMHVKDQAQSFRPVGYGVTDRDDFAANLTINDAHWGRFIRHSSATAHTLTLNTETTVPQDAWFFVSNATDLGRGVVTIVSGAGVTLRHSKTDGTVTSTTGNLTLLSGGYCSIHKLTDAVYNIFSDSVS